MTPFLPLLVVDRCHKLLSLSSLALVMGREDLQGVIPRRADVLRLERGETCSANRYSPCCL
jgi:hypothetical protein